MAAFGIHLFIGNVIAYRLIHGGGKHKLSQAASMLCILPFL